MIQIKNLHLDRPFIYTRKESPPMSQSPTFNEKIASFLENTPHLHALSVSDEKGHLLGHEPKAAQTSMSTIQTFGHLTLQNRSTLLHSVHIQGNEGQWTGNRLCSRRSKPTSHSPLR